jgi:uncharacterized membrane protein YesL
MTPLSSISATWILNFFGETAMLLFMLKKTFCDFWDHLFSIFFLNFGALLIVGAGFYAITWLSSNTLLFFLGILLAAVLFSLYLGAAAYITGEIADYKTPTIQELWQAFKTVWRTSLGFMILGILQAIILYVLIPWYFHLGHLIGVFIASLLFWVSVVWFLASQYYFPVRTRLDTNFFKVLKKSALLCLDNVGFTLFMACGTVVLLVLSGFTAFLIPGIGAILLWHQVGLKLRLYKYNYLEAHPEARKAKIPWRELLQEDQERIGPRSLRSFIFPWKD